MEHEERQLEFDDNKVAGYVYGPRDENLKVIERLLGVRISARGPRVQIQGDAQANLLAARALMQLYDLVAKGRPVAPLDVERALAMLREQPDMQIADVFMDNIFTSHRNKVVSPKGLNQKRYVDAIRRHDIVFGIGPAGTGKTYLAMAMAVAALTSQRFKRVVLTRPAVEAGEKLGFLPGDLKEKVNPYLRPLYDALDDLLDFERSQRLIERNAIEVAPLAFMRGRTLSDSFVILDEAQNTTRAQMKMFLTRLGFDSKAVITGDRTQVDLPAGMTSGLDHAVGILRGVEGISICEFSAQDVVRHPLVMRIIEAYDGDAERRERARQVRAEAEQGPEGKART